MADATPTPSELFEAAIRPFIEETRALRPAGTEVLEAHAHLGLDEDKRHLEPPGLSRQLDRAGIGRACVFPLHDPERRPAYRVPNDRVLAWAKESAGRFVPFCRLDPADSPLEEAERCLGLGARGIKLHPHSDGFNFTHPAMDAIFQMAAKAHVPVLVHCGPGIPTIIDGLTDVALRHPDAPLILAHAGVANQGLFAARLASHPAVLFDTAWFSPFDLLDLLSRVPAERVVFGSDPPYGNPAAGLYLLLRICRRARIDADTVKNIVGGTLDRLLGGQPLPAPKPPRRQSAISLHGRLARIVSYGLGAFGGLIAGNPERVKYMVVLALGVCNDPAPGELAPVLRRIAPTLETAMRLLGDSDTARAYAAPLVSLATGTAATEDLDTE